MILQNSKIPFDVTDLKKISGNKQAIRQLTTNCDAWNEEGKFTKFAFLDQKNCLGCFAWTTELANPKFNVKINI